MKTKTEPTRIATFSQWLSRRSKRLWLLIGSALPLLVNLDNILKFLERASGWGSGATIEDTFGTAEKISRFIKAIEPLPSVLVFVSILIIFFVCLTFVLERLHLWPIDTGPEVLAHSKPDPIESAATPPVSTVAAIASPVHAIEIAYDRKINFIPHPNGDSEARVSVKNTGNAGKLRRVLVKIESLVPLNDMPRDMTTAGCAAQFTNHQLQVVARDLWFDLQQQEAVQVKVIRAQAGATRFIVDGHNDKNEPQEFNMPADRYRLTVSVTSMNGAFARRSFLVDQDASGIMQFEPLPTDEQPQTNLPSTTSDQPPPQPSRE